jgi:LacI family transcriptional regulator
MTTMDDVARAAGVAGSTVSHVLNGTRHVNDETRRRVEEAITATGYRPNHIARALAAGKTYTVGLVLPVKTNPYLVDIVHAVDVAASAVGYTLMLGDSQDDPDAEERAVRNILQRKVDGVLLAPGPGSIDRAIPQMLKSETPFVLIDRPIADLECDQVVVDNFEAARELTAHVLSHGYTEIAVIKGAPGIGPTEQRYAGHLQALAEAGLVQDPGLALAGDNDEQQSRRVVNEMLESGRRPHAIVSLNNAMTLGAMHALRALRLQIPRDVALVSFDDFAWADLFAPRLTAVAQDSGRIGAAAVELLLRRMAEPGEPTTTVVVPTEFHIRDSCGTHD